LTIKTIAIISPGDMGSGLGKVLVQEGYQVLTCLEGRSTLTKELAQKAGVDLGGEIYPGEVITISERK